MKNKRKPKDLANEKAREAELEQRALNYGLMRFRKEREKFAAKFMDLWRTSKEGTIPQKYKELMELSIVLVQHCKPCIFLHTKICLDNGATRDEILEAAEVAVAMAGGVVYEYLGYLIEALEYYEKV